jgi:hypothetical protein
MHACTHSVFARNREIYHADFNRNQRACENSWSCVTGIISKSGGCAGMENGTCRLGSLIIIKCQLC